MLAVLLLGGCTSEEETYQRGTMPTLETAPPPTTTTPTYTGTAEIYTGTTTGPRMGDPAHVAAMGGASAGAETGDTADNAGLRERDVTDIADNVRDVTETGDTADNAELRESVETDAADILRDAAETGDTADRGELFADTADTRDTNY